MNWDLLEIKKILHWIPYNIKLPLRLANATFELTNAPTSFSPIFMSSSPSSECPVNQLARALADLLSSPQGIRS